MREKLTQSSLNVFKTYAKTMHLSQFSFKNIFSKLRKFSTISNNQVFRPNAQKINPLVVKFFEKYAKTMSFRNVLKKFFENFRKFSQNFREFAFSSKCTKSYRIVR